MHEFYSMRRLQYEKAEPNPMHIVIGQLQQKYGAKKVKVVTQNIDNLLEQTGCTDMLHVHGRIQYVHCFSCKHEIWEIEKTGCLQKGFYAILKKSPHMNENNFDMVYHTEAKNAAEIIEADAKKILGNAYE